MIYGILKPRIDTHSLGIYNVKELLNTCGYICIIGDSNISAAIENLYNEKNVIALKEWILQNKINNLGFSYRLDPNQAALFMDQLFESIRSKELFIGQKYNQIHKILFAGLPQSCRLIKAAYKNCVEVFAGDDSQIEILRKLGIPEHRIPNEIKDNSVYDDFRYDFAAKFIHKGLHLATKSFKKYNYKDFGTTEDTLVKRLAYAQDNNLLPLVRVHVGPYSDNRKEALQVFSHWLKELSEAQLLDIVSIGSSQLSQSNFGEDWIGKINGGGVPFNKETELARIWLDARPMLVRAYSGTKDVCSYAVMLDRSIHCAWHALSFWWFNQLDGRGPLPLHESLKQSFETLEYLARTNKPFEPNIPHHFAFRGSDDLSYIVSDYLVAKAAKLAGITWLVLQNMLNTPRMTTGSADLIKSRALLRLLATLENKNFKIIYQPRAGLDYFYPDLDKAKIQLAAVTALMDDIDYDDKMSPDIIHVVSYSEAVELADPAIINDSILITLNSLREYRRIKDQLGARLYVQTEEIETKVNALLNEAKILINHLEESIPSLYSSIGLLQVFTKGYFPVPFLSNCREIYTNATNWTTKNIKGQTCVINESQQKLSIRQRIAIIENQAMVNDRVVCSNHDSSLKG